MKACWLNFKFSSTSFNLKFYHNLFHCNILLDIFKLFFHCLYSYIPVHTYVYVLILDDFNFYFNNPFALTIYYTHSVLPSLHFNILSDECQKNGMKLKVTKCFSNYNTLLHKWIMFYTSSNLTILSTLESNRKQLIYLHLCF